MVRVLMDEVVKTDYGQLDLWFSDDVDDDGDLDATFAGQVNGVAGAAVPGRRGWTSWAGEDGGQFDLPPGPHRVRVCARGRDAGDADELADEALDFYLVQMWPAPVAPDAILRVGSKNAAYWHESWGSNR